MCVCERARERESIHVRGGERESIMGTGIAQWLERRTRD